jgi:PAS domain S-box-containing protein
MKNQDALPKDAAELRQKAEALLLEKASRAAKGSAAISPREIEQALHELRVHQIELEMQNEELRSAQEEIEAGRERFFDLYDLAPVGYCTLSEKGLILEVNLTAATLLGTTRGALINQPLSRFILKADQDIFYLQRKKLFKKGQPQECELRLVKPDGAHFWAHLAATAAKAKDGKPFCRVALTDVAERKKAEEALRQANEQLEIRVRERTTSLQFLAAELTRAEHKERQRIANLLHEDLQQRLMAIKYKVHELKDSVESAAALRTADRTIHELTEAIELTRDLTSRLVPPVLYLLGLRPALETLTKEMAANFSLAVQIKGLRKFRLPSDEISHFAFDAVRELLLNVAKHAGVKSAEIRIRHAGKKSIAVEVRDKGKGIVARKDQNGHFGIFSIRERAEAMGIGFDISSSPGKGTSVALILPTGHSADALVS